MKKEGDEVSTPTKGTVFLLHISHFDRSSLARCVSCSDRGCHFEVDWVSLSWSNLTCLTHLNLSEPVLTKQASLLTGLLLTF